MAPFMDVFVSVLNKDVALFDACFDVWVAPLKKCGNSFSKTFMVISSNLAGRTSHISTRHIRIRIQQELLA
jgi:hypothetical protein